jgi:NAD(P)-dependent dehydrogenase (short-subunit alcohol dehydrogenase family)
VDIEGKVALVTGASRGVGAAVAIELARNGCQVACAARSTKDAPQRTPGTLDETVSRILELGSTALAIPTNLAVEGDVIAMVARTIEGFGGLDILVNNAAVTFIGDLQVPLRRHDLMMDVNFRAQFLAIREVVPHMVGRGEGSIINVSSAAALYPYGDNMSYGISKIALERLTVDAAKQLQGAKVAVNCFRIDLPVASEGFVANTEGVDRSGWEPCEVPAEGIVWMIRQPPEYSGRRESMYGLRQREGIMRSRSQKPYEGPPPPMELFNGLAPVGESHYKEPYE